MEYIQAFLVGGAICALAQILLDRTKMLQGRIMVLLVCSGAVLSFLGAYDPFAEFAGAGASVPLLGFGNLLFTGVKEGAAGKRRIGIVYRGVRRLRRGPVGGSDFWVSGRADFQTETEKIKWTIRRFSKKLQTCRGKRLFRLFPPES